MQNHIQRKHGDQMAPPRNKRIAANALKMTSGKLSRQVQQPFYPNKVSGQGKQRSNNGHDDPFDDTEYSSTTNGSVSLFSTKGAVDYYSRGIDQPQAHERTFSAADVHDQDGDDDSQMPEHAGGYDGLEEHAQNLGMSLHQSHDGLPRYSNSDHGPWLGNTDGPPSDSQMDEGDADEAHATSSDPGTQDLEQDEREEERRAMNAARARSAPAKHLEQNEVRRTNAHVELPSHDFRKEQIQESNERFHSAERERAALQAAKHKAEQETPAANDVTRKVRIPQQDVRETRKRKDVSQIAASERVENPDQKFAQAIENHPESNNLAHRASSTAPIDHGPTPLSAPFLPQNNAPRGGKPTTTVAELDYPVKVLGKMTFDNLMKQDFDYDPTNGGSTSASKEPLADRLHTLADATHVEQQHFFSTMNMQDWQDSGEWFKEQFASLSSRMLQSREKRREIAVEFEADIAIRYEAVIKETNSYSKALQGMNSSGKAVLQQGTPKRSR